MLQALIELATIYVNLHKLYDEFSTYVRIYTLN